MCTRFIFSAQILLKAIKAYSVRRSLASSILHTPASRILTCKEPHFHRNYRFMSIKSLYFFLNSTRVFSQDARLEGRDRTGQEHRARRPSRRIRIRIVYHHPEKSAEWIIILKTDFYCPPIESDAQWPMLGAVTPIRNFNYQVVWKDSAQTSYFRHRVQGIEVSLRLLYPPADSTRAPASGPSLHHKQYNRRAYCVMWVSTIGEPIADSTRAPRRARLGARPGAHVTQ